MYLKKLMKEQNMTRSDLSQASGIPESTLRDIMNGKAQLDHCEAGTLVQLAFALDTTVEEIVVNYWDRLDTESEKVRTVVHDHYTLADFYSLVNCAMQRLHAGGDVAFVHGICDNRWIEEFLEAGYFRMALFLLGLIDHLCAKHGLRQIARFDAYRELCLDQPVYSFAVIETANGDDDSELLLCKKNYARIYGIPELARFNIFMAEEDIGLKP